MVLTRHRPEPAHLPEQPLQHLDPAANVGRDELPGLFGKIEQDRPGLENRNRRAAVLWFVIDDGRDAVVRGNRQELRLELITLADVDRDDPVGESGSLPGRS